MIGAVEQELFDDEPCPVLDFAAARLKSQTACAEALRDHDMQPMPEGGGISCATCHLTVWD